MWTTFYAAPTTRIGSTDWSLGVDGSLVADGVADMIGAGIASSDRLRVRSAPTGRWSAPTAAVPVPHARIDAAVTALDACGTGHHMRADVHVDVRFSVEPGEVLRTDARMGFDVDLLDEIGCALEIALVGAATGFVVGGVFGGWVGAAVGAIVGFVAGFVAVFVAVAAFQPALPSGAGCVPGATGRDLVCRQPVRLGGGELFGTLGLAGVASTSTELVLVGTAGGPPRSPARASAVRVGGWSYRRTLGGRGSYSAVSEVRVTNRGGTPLCWGRCSP
jgi:hypothetical protein